MEELPIATRCVKDNEGKAHQFHYNLVIEQIETGTFSCENYGVTVSEEDGDCVTISNITVDAERIDELITLLVEHEVGPVGAPDVIADWL